MKKLITFILIAYCFLGRAGIEPKDPKKVLIFLHEGVEILDFAGPMEVFIQAGFDVFTVALTKDPLISMGELTILPDYSIDNFPKPDIVSFYGGGWAAHKAKEPAFKEAVARVIEDDPLIFSVCSGAFFLAEAGLLDGLKVTTFHTLTGVLQNSYPNLEVLDDVRFVDNGNVITTAGISAGIEGALHVVKRVFGKERMDRVIYNMEYDVAEIEGLVLHRGINEKALTSSFSEILEEEEMIVYKGEMLDLANTYIKFNSNMQSIRVLARNINDLITLN